MTPEQKQQRIEEIREKRHAATLPKNQRGILPAASWVDIDFLLSLVKEQEAGGGNANGADAIVNQFEALRTSASLIDVEVSYHYLRGAIIKAQSEAATSMRSACVEKVEEAAQYYDGQAVTEYDQSAACAAALRKVGGILVRLTLKPDKKRIDSTSTPDRIYIDADYDATEHQGHGGFFTEKPITGHVIEYRRAELESLSIERREG